MSKSKDKRLAIQRDGARKKAPLAPVADARDELKKGVVKPAKAKTRAADALALAANYTDHVEDQAMLADEIEHLIAARIEAANGEAILSQAVVVNLGPNADAAEVELQARAEMLSSKVSHYVFEDDPGRHKEELGVVVAMIATELKATAVNARAQTLAKCIGIISRNAICRGSLREALNEIRILSLSTKAQTLP